MLRDAGLLAGKAGKGGTLGTVQRPLLSPQVKEVVISDDPALLVGFLLHGPAKPAKNRSGSAAAKASPKTTAKPGAKPAVKPAAKVSSKPAAKKVAQSRRKPA
jgi:hypothetical protein